MSTRTQTAARTRGAALLTALVLVTLVATLAAALVARQQRALALEGADRLRAQAEWVLLGALDWARLILQEDGRSNGGQGPDHLGEVWAVPLAEARLSSFLAGPGGAADDGPEAFLAGRIEDAQARYNLGNLRGEQPDGVEANTFRRLCQTAGVPSDLIETALVQLIRAVSVDAQEEGTEAALRPRTAQQLGWVGLPPSAVQALEAWVVMLPPGKEPKVAINLNTAPREVIAAVAQVDLATAEGVVQRRRIKPLTTDGDVRDQFNAQTDSKTIKGERIGWRTEHFWVTGQLRLDGRTVTLRSLVQRKDNKVTTLWRERLTPLTPGRPGESPGLGRLSAP
ncbi:type II secretion system minor pseudopilin GspK [Inhella gelatinilytica]|uniref:Type II secretion system protein K n=1 Tax=Inhella gelatinilytica TaxID=2795030 RepID=A0A931NDN1_9BURK|nr:type II secretion system minor pseudopilin GspK [Inhella gelatinilytica]MBH9552410.1 type II secretion system minor pseudopilin GspK [Inhella gelatinilytica]